MLKPYFTTRFVRKKETGYGSVAIPDIDGIVEKLRISYFNWAMLGILDKDQTHVNLLSFFESCGSQRCGTDNKILNILAPVLRVCREGAFVVFAMFMAARSQYQKVKAGKNAYINPFKLIMPTGKIVETGHIIKAINKTILLDFGQNAVFLTCAVMSWVDAQLKSYQSVITFWKINTLQLLELIGSLSINCELLKLPINSPDTQAWMLKSYSFQPLDIHAVAVKTDKFVQSPEY